MERTFVMVKTDGVHRGLIGKTINHLEQRRLKIVAMKMQIPTKSLIEDHYREHFGKEFYHGLVEYSCSGPVVAMVIEGQDAVAMVRTLLGNSDPSLSNCATLRGRLAVSLKRTAVHASDSSEAANREIRLWFNTDETIYKL